MSTRRLVLLFLVFAAGASGTISGEEASSAPAQAPRILYASDWSGTSQIYAVAPTGRRVHGQLTFGRAPVCLAGHPCGYVKPTPSPDGRRVLYWDHVTQGYVRSHLFVARADGTGRRLLAEVRSFFGEAAWAPDSRRVAYTGSNGIHVVDVDTSRRRLVYGYDTVTFGERFRWSPDGSALAILRRKELTVVRGTSQRLLASEVDGFAWSPKGDRLSYLAGGVVLVRPDGSGRKRLVTSAQPSYPFDIEWSPTGRWLAYDEGNGVRLADVTTGATRELGGKRCCVSLAWSPGGRNLAFDGTDGLTIVDAATGRARRGTDHATALRWSPDGRSVAYVVARDGYYYPTGDLRVVSLAGGVRTVIAAAGAYGGHISSITWTRPPGGLRYRRPASRSLATVRPDELVARSPIQRLAADGGQIAYISCGNTFRWTPATGEVVQAEPVASLSPRCSTSGYYESRGPYSLAIADDRVVHGWVGGGNSRIWWLGGVGLGSPRTAFTLGLGTMTAGGNSAVYGSLVGDPVGARELVVFSTWNRRGPGGRCCTVAEQALLRAEPSGCPCPEIASEPGPFVPFDVDDGRVAAGGDNDLVLLDGTGKRLLTVPVRALAAQLAGNDLVVLVHGQLRQYDAATGAQVVNWALPDVPSRGECTAPAGRVCAQARLVLQDAARGLVAYVFDGQVHVLRLSDGVDRVVAPGTLARFTDTGLVYADGSRLQIVPFERLPV